MQFEDNDIFGDYRQPRYKGLRDYHLRSALTTQNLSIDTICQWDKRLLNEVQMFYENFSIVKRDPCAILGRVLESSPLLSTFGPELQNTGKCLHIESNAFASLDAPLFKEAARMLQENKLTTKYYYPSYFFQQAIIISNAKNSDRDLPSYIDESTSDAALGIITRRITTLGITLKIGSEAFGVILEDKKLSVHHIDHLKNWSDKCTERFNIELACIFGNKLNPSIYPECSLIYAFWSVWDSYLRSYGNDMYKCVKIFESMAVGAILRQNPNKVIKDRMDFLTNTVTDFVMGLDAQLNHLIQPVREMENFLLGIKSMQYISQVYGLYRTWGHPVVNPQAGILKVYLLGTKEKTVSDIIPLQIRRIFMLRFAVWHKQSRGKYPDLLMGEETAGNNSVMRMLIEETSTKNLEQTLNSPLWDRIRYAKCIEIPKTFNLSEMVSDKAVSPDRDGLYSLSVKEGGLYDANLRRGVLQWLMRDPESCEVFLNRVNDAGLTTNECIIGLYQKEREVNETPRMFALMSHAIRNYIVTTESMISDDILPAFPNITMTNSLLSLQKKIYAVSHKQSLNNKEKGFKTFKDVTVIVNIDFEKWNLNFRQGTTYPLFEALGDLYGLPFLYNRTYEIFKSSLIYLADGSYKPKVNREQRDFVLEPPLSYIGHEGGFEGLRQKGWTVFTDCGLDLICSRHRCSYTIMGQGDNQVLALTWRTYMLDGTKEVSDTGKNILTKKFYDFMEDMISTFSQLGLPIKALETWSSENLFLYGKFPTLKGVPLAMSLKKICRAYYLANEEIMTLECSLATIQSNAMAACMSDVTSFVPYVVYKIQLFLALSSFWDYHVLLSTGAFSHTSGEEWRFTSSHGTKSRFPIDKVLSKWKFLTVLTWFPKILGGVSIASWYDFLMRGFPDRVTSSLTWLKHITAVTSDFSTKESLRILYQCHINPERNFTLLVEDPCALNLIVPVDARASVRQAVQELFENMNNVQNEEFLALFTFNKEWDKEIFCNALCEGDTLHPRFLHDLAAATLGGYVDSIVSKVSKASTINKLALRSSSSDPGHKIQMHERNYMLYLLWKTSPKNVYRTNIDMPCPTVQARELRSRSWGKNLEGVTVPHPLAFLQFEDCTSSKSNFEKCDNNYIMISLPESFCTNDLDLVHELGSSPPYLGSETKEKLGADPARQVFGKEPLISRPLSLLRVVNWFVTPGSNAEGAIFKLLQSVSNLNPQDYVSREMGITGSESHRYRDRALKHGVMSANMYTLGSHMHISTDPWRKYTRGLENYTINYQAILCTLQSLIGGHILQCYEDNTIPSREYHFHESCLDCIEALTEEFHDLPSAKVIDLIPSGAGNPYLWVEESTLIMKYKNDPVLKLDIREVAYEDYIQIENKRGILTSWIAESIANDILTEGVTETGPRLLDSKDYPRVMYKKLGVKELWEATARVLISRAGVKYTNTDSSRVAFPDKAKELAADDIMKCPSGAMMGLAMFYTWPEKFSEICFYDNGSVYPDSCPPTLMGACVASQTNLRDVIRRVSISAPRELILARTDKNPLMAIKSFWYLILCSERDACSMCLKAACQFKLTEDLKSCSALKCEFGHRVITDRMKNIRVLTASEDKLLKDSIAYTTNDYSQLITSPILTCPAVIEWASLRNLTFVCQDTEYLDLRPRINKTWGYAAPLPTNSKCRVYETLFIINRILRLPDPSHGLILGDGLGTSSMILSQIFPNTNWTAASLQDSERAIPQSFPHILIPENPVPRSNVNYKISKMLYNDVSNDHFVKEWESWIDGGWCWCEIEAQESRISIFQNIIQLSDWDCLIIRSDFSTYDELSSALTLFANHSSTIHLFLTGSINVESLESIIIICDATICPKFSFNICVNACSKYYNLAAAELYQLTGKLEYAEFLASLESIDDITQMLRRCDHWFAQVGVTHLLTCTKLFTPIWWDIQTGKVPSTVKDLGQNKVYYMYQSDKIALQARLISLAISLVKNTDEMSMEMSTYEYWELKIVYKNNGMLITLNRSTTATNYGPDQLYVLKFVRVLRKLNNLYKRWWSRMPDEITFHTNMKRPGFWVSKISQLIPVDLPMSM